MTVPEHSVREHLHQQYLRANTILTDALERLWDFHGPERVAGEVEAVLRHVRDRIAFYENAD